MHAGSLMRPLTAVLLVSGLVAGGAAMAATPKDLGTHGHWRAMTLTEGGKKSCYMVSDPIQSLPEEVLRNGKKQAVNHGDVYFMVLNSPSDSVKNESSFNVGYWLQDDSNVSVKIDKKPPVSMFTQNYTEKTSGGTDQRGAAWANSQKDDSSLASQMKAGGNMLVEGTSRRGTRTKYKFSLKGFTAALNAINKACR